MTTFAKKFGEMKIGFNRPAWKKAYDKVYFGLKATCPKCGELKTKHMMKRHQKTAKCKRASRVYRKPTPGFVYFFRSVSGWFKVGCTRDWNKRKTQYSGPSTVEEVLLVQAEDDMFKAESCMKAFVETSGYTRFRSTEWFTKK